MKKIQNVYDNKEFFDNYKAMRDAKINANELIEIPIIKKMIPDVKGKSVLDLGCGAGEMSRYLASLGAKSVLGIDISKNMIKEAKLSTNYENVKFKICALEDINKIKDKFDVVYSSLAFHYVQDYQKLMQDISGMLNENGILVFSQEHPLSTSTIYPQSGQKYIEVEGKRYFLLSDYNNTSKREMHWNIDNVVKYHRNFEVLINGIIEAGMNILEVRESTADKKAIKLVEKYKYQKDKPYYVFIKAQKYRA